MSYNNSINKSLWGREMGFQYPSSGGTGSTHNPTLLVGPEALRAGVTTSVSTAGVMAPYGIQGISTESSGVHTLAPPIPGVEVAIYSSGGATGYVKTRNNETIESSRGSMFTTLVFNAAGMARLIGLTTARWLLSGMGGDSGTSSQAPAIALATST